MMRPEPHKHRRAGFTLLELLIVLGILGVLTALGFNNFLEYRQVLRLNEARAQMAQVMERTRQYTRRYNVTYAIKLKSNGTYDVTARKADNTVLTSLVGPPLTTLPTISGKVPDGISLSFNTTNDEVVFRAPFARTDAAKDCVGVSLQALGRTFAAEIHVLGVTGRVLPRAVNKNQTGAVCPVLP
jgi:prepilin-type N-terminal cleavage/methylation domain-containing protein